MAAMQEFYENILTNPKFGTLKTQLATAMITGSLLAPSPAMAEMPSGSITYTRFLEGINAN